MILAGVRRSAVGFSSRLCINSDEGLWAVDSRKAIRR